LQHRSKFLSITAADLLARIEAGDPPAILDVRSKWEFVRGHVPGAVHVPFTAIGARLSEIPARPHQPIVVYCGYGPRAWIAGSALRHRGFERVIYLKGHMHGWRKGRLREESGETTSKNVHHNGHRGHDGKTTV
jgi:hydroxyacylglutathione hydrolase